MVLNIMKILLSSLLFIFLVFFLSCEKTGPFIVKCADCTADEPTKTELDIKIDIYESGLTSIKIYEGNLEDSILYAKFNYGSTHATYQVPLNKKFTVTATYYISGKKYIAVDSAFPRVKYDKSSCQDPCYYIYDKMVNLRLNYTK